MEGDVAWVSPFLTELGLEQFPTYPYKLQPYNGLDVGKQRVLAAARQQKCSDAYCALLLAMAMIETTTLDSHNKDAADPSKASATDKSVNFSIFNLNQDQIGRTLLYGPSPTVGALKFLNTNGGVFDAVRIILKSFSLWGVRDTLSFHRAGGSAFDNPYTPWTLDIANYHNAIRRGVEQLDYNQASMLTNNVRVEMVVKHI
jgi:hypothetical protein